MQPSFDIASEERLLKDIVHKVLVKGVWITSARRICGPELIKSQPSIHLAMTGALSRKECERAAGVVKAAFIWELMKRK